jgi:hypothetical protein
MANEYTLDSFTDALTQLPEYGGYEALSGALNEQYPDARFNVAVGGRGIQAHDWKSGLRPNASQWYNFNNTAYEPNQPSYEAMWPALTGLVNPQRSVEKMGGPNDELTDLNAPWEAGSATVNTPPQKSEADFEKTPQGYADFTSWLFSSGVPADEISQRATAFYKLAHPTVTPTVTSTVGAGVGSGDAVENVVENAVEKMATFPQKSEIKQNLDGSVFTPPVVVTQPDDVPAPTPPVNTSEETEQNYIGDGDEIGGVDVSVQTDAETAAALKEVAAIEADIDAFLENNKVVEGSLGQQPTVEDFQANQPNVNAKVPFIDQPAREGQTTYRDTPGVSAGPEPGVSRVITPTGEDTTTDNKDLETINNDIDTYLKTKGWSDSGEWGYARTRNMLTGGGLGGVVTQGALVPWQSMGQDASSRDYISNVGDVDRFPSTISSPDISEIAPKGEEKEGVKRVHSAGIGFDADAIANYGSDNSFDVTGASLFPKSTGRTEDGGIYFANAGDLGEWASGVTSATGIKGIQQRFNYNIYGKDGYLGIGNKIADASKALTKFAQDTFAFLGDPSKKKGDAPTPLMESMDNLRTEMSQFWDTNPNSQWGRKLFKPGETQDYGSLQPYAIVASLLNPPQFLATLANTVLHDFMYAAKGMFSKDANYEGNPLQDVLNGAFHLLGQGIKSVGKNAKELFSGKKKEGSTEEGSEEGKLEGEDAFMKQLFKDQENNKMRTLWDDHVMMNSSTALITQAFAGEGIPSKLYDKGMDFVNAIQSRRKAESERLHKEIMSDLGMLSTGASGDLFNLQTFMRDYSAEEGHQHFLDALEKAHRNRQK